MLNQDPDFRGVKFKKSGNNLVVETKGDKWFNKQYWFGTDEFGRDLFTRLWKGGRTSFLIAFVAVFITIFIGIIYGGVAGYLGGNVDILMMRFVEIIMVVPDLLYIILLLTVMKPGLGPIIIVLAATGWMQTAMIVRGEVLRLKNSEYVIAAEVLGADPKRIIFKHLIPNTMGPIIVNMTMMIPKMIFSEAFLSFIGLGIPAPMASWGSLVNDGAKVFTQYPQQLLVPALALSLTMLAFNILGDGLRDALDPKLRT
jgi:oligopeptide transport system permease protein